MHVRNIQDHQHPIGRLAIVVDGFEDALKIASSGASQGRDCSCENESWDVLPCSNHRRHAVRTDFDGCLKVAGCERVLGIETRRGGARADEGRREELGVDIVVTTSWGWVVVGEFERFEAKRGGGDPIGEHQGRGVGVDVEVQVFDLVEGEEGKEARLGSSWVLKKQKSRRRVRSRIFYTRGGVREEGRA